MPKMVLKGGGGDVIFYCHKAYNWHLVPGSWGCLTIPIMYWTDSHKELSARMPGASLMRNIDTCSV